jgi:hypothetical protein
MRWPVAAVAIMALATRVAASPFTDENARRRLAAAMTEVDGHIHALRYAEARDAALAALAIGVATSDEVATIARTLGETNAALDDNAEAEHWFTVWLELDPDGDLPVGSSPKLTAPLAAARARVDRPLAAAASERDGHLILTVVGDPAGFVASIDLDDEHHPIAPERPIVDLGPSSADRHVHATLRDSHGNEIGQPATWPLPSIPLKFVKHPSSPTPYIVASVGMAALGGVFLWRRSVAKDDLADILAHSEDHTLADADAARSRAERHGYLSLASFAAAGALATVAIILATRSDETITVTPTAGGLAILGTTSF